MALTICRIPAGKDKGNTDHSLFIRTKVLPIRFDMSPSAQGCATIFLMPPSQLAISTTKTHVERSSALPRTSITSETCRKSSSGSRAPSTKGPVPKRIKLFDQHSAHAPRIQETCDFRNLLIDPVPFRLPFRCLIFTNSLSNSHPLSAEKPSTSPRITRAA